MYWYDPPNIRVQFLDLGGWLSGGHLALEPQARFLAVADHWLIPARVGAVSLHGALLSLPSTVTPSFTEGGVPFWAMVCSSLISGI